MLRKDNIALWLIVYNLVTWAAFAGAEELKVKEPVVVNGDKVEYFQDKKMVIGSGNVSITYKDVVLTCDKVTVYLDTREAIAEGDVRITQDKNYFTGERVNYNFDTKLARAINGYVNYKPFYGKSQEIDKVSEKQVNLKRGYVTTCDLERPHYRVQARQVRIYFDDKVIARHILFFVGNAPIFYLPYYIQPLKERSSHATVQVGKSRDWGYFALTSFRYYFSDICKGRFLVDYRTKKGLAAGVDNYYSTKELGSGSARFYYANENDSTTLYPSGEVESKWRVQVRHKWDMHELVEDTVATMEFNQMRDKNFIRDYFYKEYEELGEPDNYISFITTKRDYATTFLVRKRMDTYFTVVERLPEFKIDIPNHRFFKDLPIYYKSESSGVYLNKTFEKADPSQKDINTIRFDAYHQLSYAARILKALSVTPYAGTRQTYYSRNKWGDTNLVRGLIKAGVDNSIKFYKIYDVESDFLGLDMHKLRHIITPTANYYYTHQPTISPDNLNQFDSIDALDTENGIALALENKLQTKRFQGEDLKSVDLATFIVSSNYMFRLRKNNVDYKSQKFENVNFLLELVPYPGVYSVSRMIVNTKKSIVQSASTDLVASKGEHWELGAGYRYENVESGKSNLLTLDGTYKINEKWKVRAYERFEIDKKAFEEQEYTIYRDLHCWIAELTYNVKMDTKEQTFWFVLRLKAFPGTPIGLKRTYYRPRFGSIGGS